jgi:hypothetical protein
LRDGAALRDGAPPARKVIQEGLTCVQDPVTEEIRTEHPKRIVVESTTTQRPLA